MADTHHGIQTFPDFVGLEVFWKIGEDQEMGGFVCGQEGSTLYVIDDDATVYEIPLKFVFFTDLEAVRDRTESYVSSISLNELYRDSHIEEMMMASLQSEDGQETAEEGEEKIGLDPQNPLPGRGWGRGGSSGGFES